MASRWYERLMAGEVEAFEVVLAEVRAVVPWMDGKSEGLLRQAFAVLAGWLGNEAVDMGLMAGAFLELVGYAEAARDVVLAMDFACCSQWACAAKDGSDVLGVMLPGEMAGLVWCVMGLVGDA